MNQRQVGGCVNLGVPRTLSTPPPSAPQIQCCSDHRGGRAPARTSRAVAEERQIKILLVDDDEMIRKSAGAFLRKMGHEVIFATNGREGLDLTPARERPRSRHV